MAKIFGLKKWVNRNKSIIMHDITYTIYFFPDIKITRKK